MVKRTMTYTVLVGFKYPTRDPATLTEEEWRLGTDSEHIMNGLIRRTVSRHLPCPAHKVDFCGGSEFIDAYVKVDFPWKQEAEKLDLAIRSVITSRGGEILDTSGWNV